MVAGWVRNAVSGHKMFIAAGSVLSGGKVWVQKRKPPPERAAASQSAILNPNILHALELCPTVWIPANSVIWIMFPSTARAFVLV